MSKSRGLQEILDQAKEKEKEYDWAKAAELYKQGLQRVVKSDFLGKGEIQETIGYCFYRAAFQADTQDEFRKRVGLSVEAYEKAARLLDGAEDSEKQARIVSCRAMALYCKSWLAENSSERKALLDECQELEEKTLKMYEEAGDRAMYGKVCNELFTCLLDKKRIASDWREKKNITEEVAKYGDKAIEALSDVRDYYELARAYCMLSFHLFDAPGTYESIEKQEKMYQKGLTYAQKALEISEKVGDSYLIGWSSLACGEFMMEWKQKIKPALEYRERALELGKNINDKFMIARAFDWLAFTVWWLARMEEDPVKRREGLNKAIQYTKDAITHYRLVSLPPLAWVGEGEYIWALAFDETNLKKKQVLLEKAVEVGRRDLEHAKRSIFPWHQYIISHSLSKALFSLSILETKVSEKKELLMEASKYREEHQKLNERLEPFHYWNRGVGYKYLAEIKAEQAKIETDKQRKIRFVEKAVLDMENCLKFSRPWHEDRPSIRLEATRGFYQYAFGGILNQMYLLTGESKHVESAIKSFEKAVQAWEKADRRSNVAEAHWQRAKLYDQLDKFSEAASEFQSASEGYALAADKIQQLKTFYTDYATYMQAWSEIEKAKQQHAEKQYGAAKEHYKKAADLHKKTQQWNYLGPNYLALALTEEAEDLSRREQAEEAKNIFQEASNLFLEARKSIKDKLEEIETADEKEMAVELEKALEARSEYCLARTALEEAKILDRQGNHASSSTKYASAAEKFQKTIDAMERESEREELRPIVSLCHAWQMMTRAEAEASPNLYLDASQLFEEAKEHSQDEKAKVLALGHSSFCRALEAGTRFEDTGDTSRYSMAKKHLEAAEKHYLKAGFRNASEYAKATHILFDAYAYMHKAETELEPTKKTQYYQMVEKLLQASSGSYMKAKHPEKSEEVKRLLGSVKEKRQLAMSLAEVLHAPAITTATSSFSTPTPTHEQAVGLERFEHADVQANLILRVTEARVGEDINLAIEVVNAGKAPALLIKVDEVIPQGFEITEVPEMYTFEDSYINMKGKRLNPLKTEDVKIVVKPRSKGTHVIKPRILYIDETGKYKSHEPEPVTILVKELGIRGWVKGER